MAAAVGAVATPAAVLIAVRQLRWQQEQHNEKTWRAELEQPKGVVVTSAVREWPSVDGQGDYQTVIATVTNLGPGTVYDVTLQWRFGSSEDPAGLDAKGPLVPGEKWECPAPVAALHLGPLDQIGVFVTFFDAESRGWAKTQRGDIVRLREAVDQGW